MRGFQVNYGVIMNIPVHRFAGVNTALVTPFDRHGDIDLEALKDLIHLQKSDGIHGITLAGSTGEAATLSLLERETLIMRAKIEAGDMLVVAGAGSNNTKVAIEMQQVMEGAGADATLHVVPYYNKPTQRGMFEHFSAIAKASKIPIILYNATGRTGVDLHPQTVLALAKEHENIIGIKDANTDVERLVDLLFITKSARPDFLVVTAEDSSLLYFLGLGGDGIISVTGQIAQMEMLSIYNNFKNGDLKSAQEMTWKLNGLCKAMFSHPNPIPIKTLLAALGLIEKHWRLPLCALFPDEEKIFLNTCREFSFVKNFMNRGFI
jgi:4-hydroxy-tetrahydrodipicolinate synthase